MLRTPDFLEGVVDVEAALLVAGVLLLLGAEEVSDDSPLLFLGGVAAGVWEEVVVVVVGIVVAPLFDDVFRLYLLLVEVNLDLAFDVDAASSI